jgi:citrate lyase beta subunit
MKAPLSSESRKPKVTEVAKAAAQTIVVPKAARFQPNRYRNKRQTQILAQSKKTKRRIKLLKTTKMVWKRVRMA